MSEITILQLPLDVLVNILSYLSYKDLRNVMLSCKTLRDLILNENTIWRAVSRGKLIVHNSLDNSQTNTFSWYHKCRISYNWCKGIYRSKIVIYHQTNYMPWLKFHNSQGLFLSVGSELRYYSTDGKGFPQCKEPMWILKVPIVKRYDVRTNDISRFVVKNGLILCGNRDGCVAVYQMNNGKYRPCLLSHIRDCHENGQVEVSTVELLNSNQKSYVITASASMPNLCFWCLKPDYDIIDNGTSCPEVVCSNDINLGECIGIRCLQVDRFENKLCIGLNGNSKPLLLDVTTGRLVFKSETTQDIKQAVRDVFWHNENVVMYVTHSGVLQLLDIRSGGVIYDIMDPFQSTLYCVKSDGSNAIFAGSSEYSRCVLFDARNSSRHMQMYFTQKKSSPIYSLDFDSTKLIAAADRSIAVLNFNVNINSVEERDYSQSFQFVNQ